MKIGSEEGKGKKRQKKC